MNSGKIIQFAPNLLALSILFETSNRRRWDVDNRVKALQDCLSAAGVIYDDTQIEELHVKRIHASKKGHEDNFKSYYNLFK